LPHYQPAPQKETPSPTNSPYSSVDATNHANNNGQQNNLINNNPKYHQPPIYNGNGNANGNTHTNGNGVVRNNVVMSASIPSGGVSASSAMQQQLQQKYYDQYENFRANGNGTVANGNGNHQNGMSQSVYNGTKAYAPPQQMTTSYNQQQMAFNNHYNSQQQPQNGSAVGKIADYDPLTDGPRNVPQTQRSNQTLIYSSEQRGAAREYSDSVIKDSLNVPPVKISPHLIVFCALDTFYLTLVGNFKFLSGLKFLDFC
jgi:LIM and SH3 domain protein 1